MADSFETEIKAGFLEEAVQLLADAERSFLALEANSCDPAILESIFRIAHNIKGSSRAVGFEELGAFTHEFESFMLKCKSGQIPIVQSTVSLLLKCNDHVNRWIDALKGDHDAKLSNEELIREIREFLPSDSAPALPPPASDERFEEAPLSAPEPLPLFKEQKPESAKAAPKAPAGDESIRVSLARLEKLLNYVGEMVILQTVLNEQSYAENPTLLRRTVHQMGKVTKEVQDISMSLRMVPIRQTFQKMQRIVRDTSAALGKKVILELEGEDTEVDKTIVESLSDPLVHLIRNAVDHGVEGPEPRLAAGKLETGTIKLSARHQSGSLLIEIRDDGAGIDAERLRAKARDKGILAPNAVMSDKDAYNLIFHSGFSTKEVVTDVSGRGVGMDVVKTNIDQLQGEILIETVHGKGTCFKVRLPLTLAIIDGMIVRSGQERYVIPLSHVHESLRPEPKDVTYVTGMGEVLSLRGENIPLYALATILSPKAAVTSLQAGTVIVSRTGEGPFCILVDDIIGHSQIVIKQLGGEHRNLKGISGSAILGDGRPALILELTELVKTAKPMKLTEAPRKVI